MLLLSGGGGAGGGQEAPARRAAERESPLPAREGPQDLLLHQQHRIPGGLLDYITITIFHIFHILNVLFLLPDNDLSDTWIQLLHNTQ